MNVLLCEMFTFHILFIYQNIYTLKLNNKYLYRKFAMLIVFTLWETKWSP